MTTEGDRRQQPIVEVLMVGELPDDVIADVADAKYGVAPEALADVEAASPVSGNCKRST